MMIVPDSGGKSDIVNIIGGLTGTNFRHSRQYYFISETWLQNSVREYINLQFSEISPLSFNCNKKIFIYCRIYN